LRRLLNGPPAYAATLARAAARGWNAFFFTPADPTPLGVLRVVVGLLLLWSLGVYGLDLRAFFGSDGWDDPEVVRLLSGDRSPAAWSFWMWVPDGLLWPVWAACMVVLALYTAGLWSRVTAVLAWLIVVSTARRVPTSLFGFDQIVSAWALYLAVTGASGQAVSLDRFLARYRQARAAVARRRHDGRWTFPAGAPPASVSANLALRLVQLHLILIYGMAGLAKLQGQGWWSGMAIWGVLASAEFRLFDLTWLVSYPWLLNLMTHGSLALEVSYPVLIWVRVLRPLYLTLVILLHAGIALTAPGLTEFGLAMVAGNLAFVSGPWLRSLVSGRDQPAGRVLYDGACPRCRASMALVAAGDPDRVVEPVDLTAVNVATIHPDLTKAACMNAMHLVRSDGRIAVGYDAVATLGRWIPLFWPVGILGSLPLFSHIGHRVYNAVAASRPRDVPCSDDVCGIHRSPAPSDRERAHR
jgi:predicted DCC family thiol-disulfide oxidoreductase YuxK